MKALHRQRCPASKHPFSARSHSQTRTLTWAFPAGMEKRWHDMRKDYRTGDWHAWGGYDAWYDQHPSPGDYNVGQTWAGRDEWRVIEEVISSCDKVTKEDERKKTQRLSRDRRIKQVKSMWASPDIARSAEVRFKPQCKPMPPWSGLRVAHCPQHASWGRRQNRVFARSRLSLSAVRQNDLR